MIISGWFESDQGAVLFDFEDVEDCEELSARLYLQYGIDCVGVDMEIEGDYLNGQDASESIKEVLEDLEFLCS